jgi:hypothetical protein
MLSHASSLLILALSFIWLCMSQECFTVSTTKSAKSTPPHGFNSPEYVARAESYIDNCLVTYPTSKGNLVLNAYRGNRLNVADLQSLLDAVKFGNDAFQLTEVVRILYLDATNETDIEAAAENFNFWITDGDKDTTWWTENLVIMFLSSHHLLNQRFGWSTHDSEHLRERLVHFLNVKIAYGYYEFLSKVYASNALNALLNLVDFSHDAEIRNLADACAQIIMRDMLMVTNEAGATYSASARDVWRFAMSATDKNHNRLIYLLTGANLDPADISPSSTGVALATSTIRIRPTVYDYWQTTVDRTYYNGHPITDIPNVSAPLSQFDDQVFFQWSSHALFGNELGSLATRSMWNKYHMWDHRQFIVYQEYENYTVPDFLDMVAFYNAEAIGIITTGANLAIFKNKNSMLSSIQDFNVGMIGYQTQPWSASTKTISIWCSVGRANKLPDPATNIQLNALPNCSQSGNLLLVGFKPDPTAFNLKSKFEVLFYWPSLLWDEALSAGGWFFGREEDSFVAVRNVYLSSGTVVAGTDRVTSTAAVQVWSVVVGNTNLYGTFVAFQAAVGGIAFVSNTTAGGVLTYSATLGDRAASVSLAL